MFYLYRLLGSLRAGFRLAFLFGGDALDEPFSNQHGQVVGFPKGPTAVVD